MDMQILTPKIIIDALTEQYAEHGRAAYWIMKNETIEMADESSLEIQIFTQNPHLDGDENEELRDMLDEDITQRIQTKFTHAMTCDESRPMKIEDSISISGLYLMGTSDYGDYCRIHFSDHTIYFTNFLSGQY